jgi:hypothetical protein
MTLQSITFATASPGRASPIGSSSGQCGVGRLHFDGAALALTPMSRGEQYASGSWKT